MLDLASLPWQINALLVETVITFFISLTLIARGKNIRRTPLLTVSMLVWNAVLYFLIFTGGTNSWQHWIYVLYVTADTAGLVAKQVNGNKEIKIDNEHLGFAVTFLLVLHGAIAWLLIAGS